MSVNFKVLSSDGSTVYIVSVDRQGDKVLATCTCQAGKHGKLCKHKIGILSGQNDLLVLSDEDARMKLNELVSEISDTACASCIDEYCLAISECEKQKKRLERAKKDLEKTLKPHF